MENFNQKPIENLSNDQSQKISVIENPLPDNPPWNWLTASGVWIASIIFLVIPSIFVIFYAVAQKVDIANAEVLKSFVLNDPTAVIIQVLLVIPAHILTFALAWIVITRFNKFSFFKTIGWQWGGFKFWHILLILVVFFLFAAGLTALFGEQDNELMRILRSSRSAVYIVAFLATFTAPIVEEVVYRGILYSALQKSFNTPIRILLARRNFFYFFYFFFGIFSYLLKAMINIFNISDAKDRLFTFIEIRQKNFAIPFAVLITTFLFALVHVPQYYPNYPAILLICLLSLVLTLIRVRTKNLLPCIVFHTIFNGIQSIMLILQQFTNLSGSNDQHTAALIHLLK